MNIRIWGLVSILGLGLGLGLGMPVGLGIAEDLPIRDFSHDNRMVKTTVSIEASDEGKQVYARVGGNAWIKIPETAAVSVCFIYTQEDCTLLTDPAEFICANAGGYWFTDVAKERWHGQLCGILESGETAVDVTLWTRE